MWSESEWASIPSPNLGDGIPEASIHIDYDFTGHFSAIRSGKLTFVPFLSPLLPAFLPSSAPSRSPSVSPL
jgi:hypothetical protein